MAMENVTERTVIAEGKEIIYQLKQKPVKNLNLRIRKDGSVYVSANKFISPSEVDAFVVSKGTYVLRAIDKFQEMALFRPQPKRYISGETFYIQGRGLRLSVAQASRDIISSDGIYIYLSVKDPEDLEKKQRMVTKFLDCQCKTIYNEGTSEKSGT